VTELHGEEVNEEDPDLLPLGEGVTLLHFVTVPLPLKLPLEVLVKEGDPLPVLDTVGEGLVL